MRRRREGARRDGVQPGRGGGHEDRSGPVLVRLLGEAGCTVDGPLVVPDGEPVEAALRDAVTAGYDVVVTTGGTGLTPGDLTPEMTRRVVDREIPGIAEAIRAGGVRGRDPGRDPVPRHGRAGPGDAHRQPARVRPAGCATGWPSSAPFSATRLTRRAAAITRVRTAHPAVTTHARSRRPDTARRPARRQR